MSPTSSNRVQRSLAQAIIGGALTGLPAAILMGWRGAVLAFGGAATTFAVAWAQNTMEDTGVITDHRKR
jgi:hypothetical protein